MLFYRGRARILDANGDPVPGALANFYLTGTDTRQDTYSDADLTIENENPVEADAYGFLSPIYLDPTLSYKVVITTSAGASLPDGTIDPIIQAAFDQATIGAILFPRTAAEIDGAVTPADYSKIPGWEGRYSSLANAATQLDHGGAPVVSSAGGMKIKGSFGSPSVRPEAQLILSNTATSGHAILTLENQSAADECAWESVGYLSTGAYTQTCSMYCRFVNSDNTAASYHTAWGVHQADSSGDDWSNLTVWSNNSVRLTGPNVGSLPFNDMPAANWVDIYSYGKARLGFVAGDHAYSLASTFALEVSGGMQVGDVDGSKVTDHAVRMGYSSGGATGYIESYRNSTSAYIPLLIQGSEINFAQGDIKPTTDNVRSIGAAGKRIVTYWGVNGAINTSDATEKDFRDEDVSSAEIAWAKEIKKLFRGFRWKADAKKEAKLHFGVSAQAVEQAGRDCGIEDPLSYYFIRRDWITDEETGKERWRYGICYDELYAFLLAAAP